MEAKKNITAVEWIKKELEEFGTTDFCRITWKEFDDLFKQAKEMEREQIIKARQNGLDNGFGNGNWDSNFYYNETYGNK